MSFKKFDAQFLLAIIIIGIWAYFLYKPLNLIDSIHLEDPAAKERLTAIMDVAYKVSALFSTALGFVLGHYFGKQGIETAQEQASQANQEKAKAIKNKDVAVGAADVATDKYQQLEQQINRTKEEIALEFGKVIEQLKSRG